MGQATGQQQRGQHHDGTAVIRPLRAEFPEDQPGDDRGDGARKGSQGAEHSQDLTLSIGGGVERDEGREARRHQGTADGQQRESTVERQRAGGPADDHQPRQNHRQSNANQSAFSQFRGQPADDSALHQGDQQADEDEDPHHVPLRVRQPFLGQEHQREFHSGERRLEQEEDEVGSRDAIGQVGAGKQSDGVERAGVG